MHRLVTLLVSSSISNIKEAWICLQLEIYYSVWWCARSTCTPPILAWARGACVSVRVLAFTLPILAGVVGRGLFCARSACTPPFVAGVCDGYVWFGFWLRPAFPGLGVRCGCVSFGSGVRCTPEILTGLLGRVCLSACSACSPPVQAGVCGVGVCPWVRVSAARRKSWLGCWGVIVCVGAPPVPRHSWLGFVVCGLRVAWHLFPCRGWLRVVRAARVFGTRWPLLHGTCPRALVVAGGELHGTPWYAAPRPVRSLSVLSSALLTL